MFPFWKHPRIAVRNHAKVEPHAVGHFRERVGVDLNLPLQCGNRGAWNRPTGGAAPVAPSAATTNPALTVPSVVSSRTRPLLDAIPVTRHDSSNTAPASTALELRHASNSSRMTIETTS